MECGFAHGTFGGYGCAIGSFVVITSRWVFYVCGGETDSQISGANREDGAVTPKEHAQRLVDSYTRNGLGDPRESTDHAIATAVAYLDLVRVHDELRQVVSHIDAKTVMAARKECGMATVVRAV